MSIIVWHGSPNKFTHFSIAHINKHTPKALGLGFYLSSCKQIASSYHEDKENKSLKAGYLYEVLLNDDKIMNSEQKIKNIRPLLKRFLNIDHPTVHMMLENWSDKKTIAKHKLLCLLLEQSDNLLDLLVNIQTDIFNRDAELFAKHVKEIMNIDGIFALRDTVLEYCIFNSDCLNIIECKKA